MENLQCLCKLGSPSVQFWQYLTQNNVVGNSLQELTITFAEFPLSVEKLGAMVVGLLTLPPL